MLYKTILAKLKKKHFCPFCKRNRNFIIAENKFAYLTRAQAPYVKDHLLIIPKRHVVELRELRGREKEKIFDLMVMGVEILKKKYSSIEMEYKEGDLKISGKSIPHLHFHLIPKTKRLQRFESPSEKRKFLSDKELIEEAKKFKKI